MKYDHGRLVPYVTDPQPRIPFESRLGGCAGPGPVRGPWPTPPAASRARRRPAGPPALRPQEPQQDYAAASVSRLNVVPVAGHGRHRRLPGAGGRPPGPPGLHAQEPQQDAVARRRLCGQPAPVPRRRRRGLPLARRPDPGGGVFARPFAFRLVARRRGCRPCLSNRRGRRLLDGSGRLPPCSRDAYPS